MMTRKSWAVGVAVVVVAFGAGWLGAKLTDVNKVPVGEMLAGRWISDIETLVGNPRTLQFVDPADMSFTIRSALSTDSIELARYYDHLSPQWKSDVVFQLPAARAIVNEGGKRFPSYRNNSQDLGFLKVFIDCVQQVQTHGGSVRKCARHKEGWDHGEGLKAGQTIGAEGPPGSGQPSRQGWPVAGATLLALPPVQPRPSAIAAKAAAHQ